MEKITLDKLDEKILKLVSSNARTPFLEVARECNVSGAAIHQRVQKLISLGVITGSEFTLDPVKVGYTTCAYMGIFLKDANDFTNVVAGLKSIPEVVECHYTTGKFALYVKIYARESNNLKIYAYEKVYFTSSFIANGVCISCGTNKVCCV